jgi:hypothetical protein
MRNAPFGIVTTAIPRINASDGIVTALAGTRRPGSTVKFKPSLLNALPMPPVAPPCVRPVLKNIRY